MERVLKFLRRTAEMVSGAEFRPRGRQTRFVKEHFRPWVLQTPPGSYQFAVALERQPSAKGTPREVSFESEVVTQAMAILSAATETSGGALGETVPDRSYQSCFLKLAYDLAPSGESHDRLVLQSIGVAREPEVTLDIGTRRELARTLWPNRSQAEREYLPDRHQLTGRLHAVDLKGRWLELTDGSRSYRVTGVSSGFRDSVVALLDQIVVVDATRVGGRYRLAGIEKRTTH